MNTQQKLHLSTAILANATQLAIGVFTGQSLNGISRYGTKLKMIHEEEIAQMVMAEIAATVKKGEGHAE